MSPRYLCIPISLLLCAALFSTANARIIHVPDDEATIQAGINATENGDTVLVAPGRYRETITFGGNEIVVAGEYLTTGDEELIAQTIIDGAGGNGHSVVAIREGEGDGAELAGFTIINGSTDYGGGVYCTSTRPLLHHLMIDGCTATNNGGGLYTTRDAEVIMHDAFIQNCSAGTGGGGVTCYFSAVTTLENVVITDNEANSYGGGVQCSQSAEIVLRNCLVENNSSGSMGGGCFSYENATMTLENCVVKGNNSGSTGGGFQSYHTNLIIDHTLITENNSGGSGEAVDARISQNNVLQLINSTIVDNDNSSSLIYWQGGAFSVTNTIITKVGEERPNMQLDGGACSVSYSDIFGGEELFQGAANLEWGDGNFDETPRFEDPENGNYELSPGSPCIDTGDPNGPNDPDGTRADVGAFPYQGRVVVEGVVTDAANGRPIEGVQVTVNQRHRGVTDGDGFYRITRIHAGEISVTVSVPAYNDSTSAGFEAADFDTVRADFGLLHPEIQASVERIDVRIVPGDSTTERFSLRNHGNGWLTWSSAWSNFGERAVEPFHSRRTILAGEITRDMRINSALFAGDNFFLAGSNVGDTAQIYVLNRAGELQRSFNQPGTSRYGFKDTEWDGEWIWGSGEHTVYAVTPEGEVMRSFEGPYNPNTNLAFDSVHEILWLSGITTNLSAYDRAGNALGRVLQRKGLRMYGLGYWPDDPDGYPLYIVSNFSGEIKNIYKMDPETGDTLLVHPLVSENPEAYFGGCSITNDYDPVGAVMVTTEENGVNDLLQILQVQSTPTWIRLEPGSGSIASGQEQELTLSLSAAEVDSNGLFYEAEIVISHNAAGDHLVIPVSLDVSRNQMAFELRLVEGWNLFSAPVRPDAPGIPAVMRSLVQNGTLIFFKDGQGRFYHPAWNVNNVPDWDFRQGYLAKLSAGTVLQMYGEAADSEAPIPLTRGWNMISYLPEFSQDAEAGFGPLGDRLLIAKDGVGRFYLPRFRFNSLPPLQRRSGYQIKTTESFSLVWPEGRGRIMSEQMPVALRYFPAHASTGSNMSLLMLGVFESNDGEIGVYTASGVYCGAISLMGDAPWGGAVWGDDPSTSVKEGAADGEKLVFEFKDGQRSETLQPQFAEGSDSYQADGLTIIRVGDEIPVDFTLSEPYPNPFNGVTAIEYSLPRASTIKLAVYDMNGREVAVLAEGRVEAGAFRASWEAGNVNSGVYMIRLTHDGGSSSRKVILVK